MKHSQGRGPRAIAQRFRPGHDLAQQKAIDEFMPAQALPLVHEYQCLFFGRERWLANARQETGEFLGVKPIVAIGIHWHQVQQ